MSSASNSVTLSGKLNILGVWDCCKVIHKMALFATVFL